MRQKNKTISLVEVCMGEILILLASLIVGIPMSLTFIGAIVSPLIEAIINKIPSKKEDMTRREKNIATEEQRLEWREKELERKTAEFQKERNAFWESKKNAPPTKTSPQQHFDSSYTIRESKIKDAERHIKAEKSILSEMRAQLESDQAEF